MFRNKPVIREAVQYTGSNFEEIVNFCNSARLEKTVSSGIVLIIPTLEGQHVASPGDWIIKGTLGEFYPCKPEAFEKTYEPID